MNEWLVVLVSVLGLLFILRHLQTLENKKPKTFLLAFFLYGWMILLGVGFVTLACWIIYDAFTLIASYTHWQQVYVFAGTSGSLLMLCIGYTYRYRLFQEK